MMITRRKQANKIFIRLLKPVQM